jgi:hypothetical protein
MARSRYDLMENSLQTDEQGEAYPDVVTYPINFFSNNFYPQQHVLTAGDLARWDLFIFDQYNDIAYKDILIWLNKVGDKHLFEVSDNIIIFNLEDLRDFYSKFLRVNS